MSEREIHEVHEKIEQVRRFHFIPEVERGETLPSVQQVEIVIVGSPSGDVRENKEVMGRYIVRKTAQAMKSIIDSGKIVLWNMATGATFNWPKFLPGALQEAGVDPSKVIPMVKEEAWNTDGKHFPPGHPFDFRGRRIEGFHKPLGLEPHNMQVSADGTVSGNILAPNYTMSPEEGARYMNETWKTLMATGKVETLTTTGVGTDLHVGEMQINTQGFEPSMAQRDFFLLDEADYSRIRGMFMWADGKGGFREEDNLFVELDEQGMFRQTGRAVRLGTPHFGKIMGIGYRAMLESKGGALFAFDSDQKAFAARMALEGSFSGKVVDEEGRDVGRVTRDKGEGEKILPELFDFCKQLEMKGILDLQFFVDLERFQKQKWAEEKEPYLANWILSKVYVAYEQHRILAQNNEHRKKYYEPLWLLVNRYIGKRSPLSRQIRGLITRGVKIELVMTPEAARDLPFAA